MASITLKLNNKNYTIEADPKMPLLWAIRDLAGLTGTNVPVSSAANKNITTIEGLSTDNSTAVQRAWILEQVPQCGYCQSGQIMAASALLKRNPNPTDKDIDAAMQGHICRCGTYPRIRKAIKTAAQLMTQK